jgi:hypothetical protein
MRETCFARGLNAAHEFVSFNLLLARVIDPVPVADLSAFLISGVSDGFSDDEDREAH